MVVIEHYYLQILSYVIFIVSVTLMIISIVTGAIFYNPYYEYNTLDAASYSALHRTVWAIGIYNSLEHYINKSDCLN